MVKHCSECGAKLKDGAKFCPECGNKIQTAKQKDHKKDEVSKNKFIRFVPKLYISISVILILILGSLLLMLSGGSLENGSSVTGLMWVGGWIIFIISLVIIVPILSLYYLIYNLVVAKDKSPFKIALSAIGILAISVLPIGKLITAETGIIILGLIPSILILILAMKVSADEKSAP